MRSTRPALGFILITIALDVLGFGLLIPVGPKLIESLLHGGQGGTQAEAAPYVAALMTTWYAMAFIFSPMLGALSDRVGRRPVILIALLGSGLDFFAQALAPSIGWLFVTRAINGVSGASMTVANAYVADVTSPEKRAAAFGLVGAAFGLGFVIGPALGGWLGQIDIRLPFYIAGTLTLLNWLYGLIVLPESLPADRRNHMTWKRINPLGAFAVITHYPFVVWMAGSLFLLNMAQFGLHATWALYTEHRFHWTTADVGWSLFAVGISTAIVQGAVARPFIARLGERRALLFGVFVSVLAYIGYGLAPTGFMLYVILGAASIGGVAMPAAQSMITRSVRPTEQGAVQGALLSLQSVAGIFGSQIGGWVLHRFISDAPPFDLPGASFIVSALLAALGWIVAGLAVRLWEGNVAPAAIESPPVPSPETTLRSD